MGIVLRALACAGIVTVTAVAEIVIEPGAVGHGVQRKETVQEYEITVTADGAETTASWVVREPQPSAGAQNVIFFIADGGSAAVYTAARLMSRGIDAGTYGGNLVFEDFEELGFLHTSGIDSVITDSANSASSYNTGHKTAVNANGVYPDTSYDKFDDPRVEKYAYLVSRLLGKSVGIVTNSNWSDATPNGVAGFGRDRSNTALNAYVTQPLDEGLLPEVIMGGGARNMLPASADGSRRDDERDVFADYEAAGYTVITTGEELDEAVNGGELPERLLGIFHPHHMDVWLDRNVFTDNVVDFPDQPDLDVTTLAALEILSQNENGFYLQVEGSSIDKALHPMDFDRALADTIEFERAVAAAVEWVEANAPDTLIIVTREPVRAAPGVTAGPRWHGAAGRPLANEGPSRSSPQRRCVCCTRSCDPGSRTG